MTSENLFKLCCRNFIVCCLGYSVLPQAYALASPQGLAIRLSEAKKLMAEGKYGEAEASVNALIARQPSADAFDLLGNIFEQQNKLDRAEDAYRQALRLDAAKHSSRVRLGIVYGKRAKYAQCVDILTTLQNEIRNNPEALYYLCRAFLEGGNTLRALQTAAMVEQLAEKDPGAVLSVGRLLVSRDLYQQAIPMLQKTVSQLPKSSEAHYSLALALFKMRQMQARVMGGVPYEVVPIPAFDAIFPAAA